MTRSIQRIARVLRHLKRGFRTIYVPAIVGSVFVVLVGTFFVIKTALPVSPSYTKQQVSVDEPLVISLGQNVKAIDTAAIVVTPKVEGAWQHKKGSITEPDALVFTPKTYFLVNTAYRMVFPEVDRVAFGSKKIPEVNFKTEAAPKITNAGLAEVKDGSVLPADYAVKVALSSPNRDLRHIVLKTTPAIELEKTVKDDKQYMWRPKTILPQGAEVKFEIIDDKNRETLLTRTVKIANEPQVKVPVKQSHVTPKDVLQLEFFEPITPESRAFISFDTEGKDEWKSDTVYAFTPTTLIPGKEYGYSIKKGLRSKAGGILQTDNAKTFTTTGAVSVVSSSPRGGELSQGSQVIRFVFDQPVDRASAEERFSVSHGETVAKAWSGNELAVTVRNLGYQQAVTATIGSGVKNAEFGLPSTQNFKNTFTTEVRTTRLSAPFYGQQHRATCAVASLRMALAYRGIHAGEMDIVGRMGYNPRNLDTSTGVRIWDDPMKMFVGSVDGRITDGTGAGPDAPPVAAAARSFGRGASSVMGISAGWIAQQVHDGNPVVMFGAFGGNSGFVEWQTPTGSITRMNRTSHATLVVGVKGEPNNPIGFWVSDPLSGTSYWTAGAVATNISRDVYRQAVVVY